MIRPLTAPIDRIPLNRPDHPSYPDSESVSGPHLLEVEATIESKVSRKQMPYYDWTMSDPHADRLIIDRKFYCAGQSAKLFDWRFMTPHDFATMKRGIFRVEVVTNDRGYLELTRAPLYVSPSAEEMRATRSRVLNPLKPRPPGVVKVGAEVSFFPKDYPDRKHIGTVKEMEGNTLTVRVGDVDWKVEKQSVTASSKGFMMFNPDPSPFFIKPAVLIVELPSITSQIVADAIQIELSARYSTLLKGSAIVTRLPHPGVGTPVVRGVFGVSDEEQPDSATLRQARGVVADVLKQAKIEWLGPDLASIRHFIAENPIQSAFKQELPTSRNRITQ